MLKYFLKYIWKNGIPYGITPLSESDIQTKTSFKLVADPYKKHITIEKYVQGNFDSIVFDSQLINFKKLKPEFQTVWSKEVIRESVDEMSCLIRDQDDRIIYIEEYQFTDNICRKCLIKSPLHIDLAYQAILLKKFGDPFNGVVLFDRELVPVMYKEYQVEEESCQFMELLKEEWKIEPKEYEWLRSSFCKAGMN